MPKLTDFPLLEEIDAVLMIDREGAHPVHVNGKGPPVGALTVRFQPWTYSGEYEKEIKRITAEEGPAAATVYQAMSTIKKWDLTDKAGKPIPLTKEALTPLSWKLLFSILNGCSEAATPSKSGDQ